MVISPMELAEILDSVRRLARSQAMHECANMPLSEEPLHPEEKGSAAHLRDMILKRLGREMM